MAPKRQFDAATAKDVVKRALKLVAAFRGDNIESFTFQRFKPYHKKVFIDAVKVYTNAVKRDDRSYYDIRLTGAELEGKTVGEFIQFLEREHSITGSSESLDLNIKD